MDVSRAATANFTVFNRRAVRKDPMELQHRRTNR